MKLSTNSVIVEVVTLSLIALFYPSCNNTKPKVKYVEVSGRVEICNNHDCGKILGDSLSIERVLLPIGESTASFAYRKGYLYKLIDSLGRGSDIERSISRFVKERILETGAVDKSDNPFLTPIITNNSLSFDSSSFCDSCRAEFGKYGFKEGTSPKKLYLKRAGFSSERQLKSKLSRVLRSKYYKESVYFSSKSAEMAISDGAKVITWHKGTLKEAISETLKSYPEWIRFYRSRTTTPDEMGDEEWYDYMEGLSSDPLWKETVREQRKSKGIK